MSAGHVPRIAEVLDQVHEHVDDRTALIPLPHADRVNMGNEFGQVGGECMGIHEECEVQVLETEVHPFPVGDEHQQTDRTGSPYKAVPDRTVAFLEIADFIIVPIFRHDRIERRRCQYGGFEISFICGEQRRGTFPP